MIPPRVAAGYLLNLFKVYCITKKEANDRWRKKSYDTRRGIAWKSLSNHVNDEVKLSSIEWHYTYSGGESTIYSMERSNKKLHSWSVSDVVMDSFRYMQIYVGCAEEINNQLNNQSTYLQVYETKSNYIRIEN